MKVTASAFNPSNVGGASELKVGASSFTPNVDAPAFVPGGSSTASNFNPSVSSSFYPSSQQ